VSFKYLLYISGAYVVASSIIGPFNGINHVKIESIKKRMWEGSNMGLALEIARILLPVVIVGGIAIFVVMRMKHKYKKGTLGKKESKGAQNFLDSLIPLGMMIGCAVAVLLSMFFPIPLLSTIGLGSGIGLLFGYFAYEIYSKKGEVIGK